MRRGAGARFFGSYTNKIDSKGRLATPAAFRAKIDLAAESVIYCIPSTEDPCIECGDIEYVDGLMAMIDRLDPYSEQRQALELAVATQMRPLKVDGEGRIVLTDDLVEHASLNGEALFAGRLRSFQIWNPETFAHKLSAAKKVASEAKLSLRNPPIAGEAS